MATDTFWKYFFEIYETLPRQGPGDIESTQRALQLLPPLAAHQRHPGAFAYCFFVMQRK